MVSFQTPYGKGRIIILVMAIVFFTHMALFDTPIFDCEVRSFPILDRS